MKPEKSENQIVYSRGVELPPRRLAVKKVDRWVSEKSNAETVVLNFYI
jgi:ribosomal protein L31E